MKKYLYLFYLIFPVSMVLAQSGEITTNGIVYPRYTTATRPTGTLTPGTTIFNTTLNTHQYYNGSTWVSITNATGGSPWTLSGNNIHNNSGSSVGINSSKPAADLEIQGGAGLLITQPYTVTTSPPAAPVTMPYSGTLPAITAQAGRILDPGGAGNYLTNTNYASYIRLAPTGTTSGFRLTFESLELGIGCTIFLSTSSYPDNYDAHILRIYHNSNYAVGKPFLISGNSIYLHFIINSGSVSAPGFQLLYEQVAVSNAEGPQLYSEALGRGLSYSSLMSSFSIGSSNARGSYSTAMGSSTLATGSPSIATGSFSAASGAASTAMGFYTSASGLASTAMGRNTIASGENSTAIGRSTTANGSASTAMGNGTTASGYTSTAMGLNTTASGDYTTTMGSMVSTNDKEGSFMIGDSYNGATILNASSTNAFYSRFRNGYYLYSSANNTNGVRVLPSGTSWSSLSDSTKKERFIAANNEHILNSVASMRVGTWNYKGDAENRHWGVMAQDFYKHFGKDKYGTIGNDTTIATADFDGVAFAAIKGLEERTTELKVNNEKLKTKSEKLEYVTEELKANSEQLRVYSEQLKVDNEKLKTKSEKLEYVTQELKANSDKFESLTEELLAKSEKLERENAELKKRLEKLEALLTDTVSKR